MYENNLPWLPVSTQEFTVIREDKLAYVDKTDLVWQLANSSENVVFFSRPRRFGKTMLLSTLETYFQGKKEYFEGLKIMELEKEWRQYEVLRFDLSGSTSAFGFDERLKMTISRYEKHYGIINEYNSVGARFDRLIETAAAGERKVVCLFDEYDYPLQHTLFHQEEEHEKLKAIYRDFFSVLKAQSRYIRFVFITGITKFTGLSLFSVLNNMVNLSFYPQYQALCGITKEELHTTLLPYVERLAQKNNMDVDTAFDRIKANYDGYHFCDEMLDIYNPYCLINALNQAKLVGFWASSGNTQMLMDAVGELGWDDSELDNIIVDRIELEQSDVSKNNLPIFLYQSGYLTIKGFDEDSYTLGIPNLETKSAMASCILPRLLENKKGVQSSIVGMKRALTRCEVDTAFDYLRALVAGTPYSNDKTVPAVEEKFQFIVKNALYLCNCLVQEEVHVAKGRIDIVAEHIKCILIIELKMTAQGGVEAAQAQIETRDYAAAYRMSNKPIYTVAIEFNGETRQIGEMAATCLRTGASN